MRVKESFVQLYSCIEGYRTRDRSPERRSRPVAMET